MTQYYLVQIMSRHLFGDHIYSFMYMFCTGVRAPLVSLLPIAALTPSVMQSSKEEGNYVFPAILNAKTMSMVYVDSKVEVGGNLTINIRIKKRT